MNYDKRHAISETELTEKDLDSVIGGGSANRVTFEYGGRAGFEYGGKPGFEYGGVTPLETKNQTPTAQK